jgi:cobalt-zinc-cadmium efflux system outer membrane protein
MGRDAEFARPNRFRLRARRFALNLPCSCAARRLQWSPFVVASWYAFGALLPRPSGVAVILSVLAFAGSALAQVPAPALPTDHTLAELIHDSLSARPELSQALAVVRAQEERVSQAGAMPDPMFQVGIQNDGFTSIEIGQMPTSFISFMASQTFPWPGKRPLREEVAQLAAGQNMKGVLRLRLSTEAEVRRTYLELVLARDRLALLEQLHTLWERSAAFAQVRYETGGGAQADVLRAQLELSRVEQRRFALLAVEQGLIRALNRLRSHPLGEPIDTSTAHIRDWATLAPFERLFSVEDALKRSPELAAARLGTMRADKALNLADKSYFPDLTVSAGIMYRGQLPPMWLATVGGPVPIFAGSKQNRLVAENGALLSAAQADARAIEQLIRLRSAERSVAFSALRQTIEVYQRGLLAQSGATADSMLAQYRVGKVSILSVLEATLGFIADQDGFLESIAAAQRILIAEAEVSLAAGSTPNPNALAPTAMPGAGDSTESASGM